MNAAIYPEATKMQKQMRYANQLGVRYVVIIGEQEVETRTVTLKDMVSGEQEQVSASILAEKLNPSR
jgi:histidyl-tRNA synthetase